MPLIFYSIITNFVLFLPKRKKIQTCVAVSPRSLSDCAERDLHRLEQIPLVASLHGLVRTSAQRLSVSKEH